MSETDYNEDLSISKLDEENLEIYLEVLEYYITHPDSKQALFDCISNSIELSDNMPKQKYSYADEQIEPLKKILGLIGKVLPTIKDETLKKLLKENHNEITKFLDRIGQKYEPDKYYKEYEYYGKYAPEYKKLIKDTSKTISKDLENSLFLLSLVSE